MSVRGVQVQMTVIQELGGPGTTWSGSLTAAQWSRMHALWNGFMRENRPRQVVVLAGSDAEFAAWCHRTGTTPSDAIYARTPEAISGLRRVQVVELPGFSSLPLAEYSALRSAVDLLRVLDV